MVDFVERRQGLVRLENLEILVKQAGSATALARLAGTSGSYLSQIRNQFTTPKGTPRGIGNALAEKLERALGKPHGWMDEQHIAIGERDKDYKCARPTDGPPLHPLIEWKDAKKWRETKGKSNRVTIEQWMPCPLDCSLTTFILRVSGESMAPRFRSDDLIFVDPETRPRTGMFVIVLQSGKATPNLRQLIVENGNSYLKTINASWPDHIIRMTRHELILGVIVFHGSILLEG